MRTFRLLIAAAALTPAVGCSWMKEVRENFDQARNRPTGKIEEVAPERLVKYLNDQADALRSIEYSETTMRVSGKNVPIPARLDGNLASCQPRSFRMVSNGRVASVKLDMGSNPEQFWVYVAAPGDPPLYVYASHADFERGQAKLPGEMPFEPDWVMQALGMVHFPEGEQYDRGPSGRAAPINEKDRTYTLRWSARTPAGKDVKKEVVFDADAAAGSRSQVRKHVIRDARTDAVIASAEIKAAQTTSAGATGKLVQYPTHVVLRWEEQKFELDLSLGKAQINHISPNDAGRQALFTRPEIRGAKAIDLARYEFQPFK